MVTEPIKEVEKPKNEFTTWLLHLPPINLWTVKLLDIFFGKEEHIKK